MSDLRKISRAIENTQSEEELESIEQELMALLPTGDDYRDLAVLGVLARATARFEYLVEL